MDRQPEHIHTDALTLLLEAMGNFCDVNEIARKKDPHLFLRPGHAPFVAVPQGGVTYSTTIEDVARDLFYSPELIPQKITMCLEDFLNSEAGKRANFQNLFEYFLADEACILFVQKRNHVATQNNQFVHEIIVGNIQRGWILSFIGNYGEYNKRDWDVRAAFSVTVGLSREELGGRLASRIEKWARVEVVALANSIQQTTKNLPANLQHLVWENILRQYGQSATLNPLNIWHEKRALREVLNTHLGITPYGTKIDIVGGKVDDAGQEKREKYIDPKDTPEKSSKQADDTNIDTGDKEKSGRRKM